ncbi:hypothetical protein PF327_02855 [Sulfurovum sp. XTW-4]|uniref:Response regulatory domain-containing protein n=1 Tax=Sulfurovum xiamenensis TaxID=3019066 RepID=A0ABT7QPZ2_9BACT|nr:hypothetical protein [Sulfurovum xiamenensis]MDM5263128.1 hypothetical protein [Sulfurovum xiamenensis]
MNILLININPVVSRLLALCTRDENIALDEVVSADAVKKASYDIIFVDEVSYVNDVQVLLEALDARKKVFISYAGEAMMGFDETIKKPFLPSQIINVIESITPNDADEREEGTAIEEDISIFPFSLENKEAEDEILPDIVSRSTEEKEDDTMSELEEDMSLPEVLDRDEVAKIKALLEMDDEIEENENTISLSDDDYEARKVEVIKEQLIADGLEIVEENEIVEELSYDAVNAPEEREGTLSKTKQETGVNEEELSRIEVAIWAALGQMKPKKIKKLLKGKETKIKIKLEDDQ